jgi:heme/copper-type cytochrome/quinol oxidase subunit 1
MTIFCFGWIVAHFNYALVRTRTFGIVGEKANFWKKMRRKKKFGTHQLAEQDSTSQT